MCWLNEKKSIDRLTTSGRRRMKKKTWERDRMSSESESKFNTRTSSGVDGRYYDNFVSFTLCAWWCFSLNCVHLCKSCFVNDVPVNDINGDGTHTHTKRGKREMERKKLSSSLSPNCATKQPRKCLFRKSANKRDNEFFCTSITSNVIQVLCRFCPKKCLLCRYFICVL